MDRQFVVWKTTFTAQDAPPGRAGSVKNFFVSDMTPPEANLPELFQRPPAAVFPVMRLADEHTQLERAATLCHLLNGVALVIPAPGAMLPEAPEPPFEPSALVEAQARSLIDRVKRSAL